jgi:hypothetical protein
LVEGLGKRKVRERVKKVRETVCAKRAGAQHKFGPIQDLIY